MRWNKIFALSGQLYIFDVVSDNHISSLSLSFTFCHVAFILLGTPFASAHLRMGPSRVHAFAGVTSPRAPRWPSSSSPWGIGAALTYAGLRILFHWTRRDASEGSRSQYDGLFCIGRISRSMQNIASFPMIYNDVRIVVYRCKIDLLYGKSRL